LRTEKKTDKYNTVRRYRTGSKNVKVQYIALLITRVMTRDQKRFTISGAAADWHELMKVTYDTLVYKSL